MPQQSVIVISNAPPNALPSCVRDQHTEARTLHSAAPDKVATAQLRRKRSRSCSSAHTLEAVNDHPTARAVRQTRGWKEELGGELGLRLPIRPHRDAAQNGRRPEGTLRRPTSNEVIISRCMRLLEFLASCR